MSSDYVTTLRTLWREHQTPKPPDAPTVVSLFAGCGGSSLGYSAAGFRELLAAEWDTHAASLFRTNLPNIPVHSDVAHLDPAALPLERGELDVLDGSPPCQGFSTAGRRQVDDPRNSLFREYVRLLDAWNPKVLVMENVAGMNMGRMKALFGEIMHELAHAGDGYDVRSRLVDASWLGVPQQRKRLIFIGVRRDLDTPPLHPKPFRTRVTVRDAFAEQADTGPALPVTTPKVRKLIPHVPPGRHGGNVLTSNGKKGSFFSLRRLAWDRPSFVITKGVHAGGGGALLHPDRHEPVGAYQLARLQSFPDEYDWQDSGYRDIQARVGNSVPPLMMREIARVIREKILTAA